MGYGTHSEEGTHSLCVLCGWYANVVVVAAISSAILSLFLVGGDGLLQLYRLGSPNVMNSFLCSYPPILQDWLCLPLKPSWNTQTSGQCGHLFRDTWAIFIMFSLESCLANRVCTLGLWLWFFFLAKHIACVQEVSWTSRKDRVGQRPMTFQEGSLSAEEPSNRHVGSELISILVPRCGPSCLAPRLVIWFSMGHPGCLLAPGC